MLSLPPSVRIFVCLRPTDMRRSFDGLARMASEIMEQDSLSGHLFVFGNRRGDRVKILYWDRDGYALWYKRLEQGVFRFPQRDGDRIEVTSSELSLVLDGIDVRDVSRPRRYRRRTSKTAASNSAA